MTDRAVRFRWAGLTVAVAVAVAAVVALAVRISPPVFRAIRTPQATIRTRSRPDCPWVDSAQPIETKVHEVVERMTLREKATVLSLFPDPPRYENVMFGIPRLCIPHLILQDGAAGVAAGMRGVTQLPAPIALAASWDPSLAHAYGTVQGQESWGKGIDVAQGPDINIARTPENGLTYEGYGEDPYLVARTAVADIEGIQHTGVMSDVHHYAANNQQTTRGTIDEQLSHRALHEIYLPGFSAAVQDAHVASVMCAYNQVNGNYACQNPYLLKNVLFNEFKFKGFVRSDDPAVHNLPAAYDAGMDQDKPGQPGQLVAAVRAGRVPVSQVNDAVSRVLREMFRFGLFDRQPSGTPQTVVTNPQHVQVAQDVAEQGAVLLKNSRDLLPLDDRPIHSIAVIGNDAGVDPRTRGLGASAVSATRIVTPYEGILHRAGPGRVVSYQASPDLTVPYDVLRPPSGVGHGLLLRYYNYRTNIGRPFLTQHVRSVSLDTASGLPARPGRPPVVPRHRWLARWTGTLTAPVTGSFRFMFTSDQSGRLLIDRRIIIDNQDSSTDRGTSTGAGSTRLVAGKRYLIEVDYRGDGQMAHVRLDWLPPAGRPYAAVERAARNADVAVVFAGDVETEGTDRRNLTLPDEQDALISAVASANPNTVVVLNTGSAVTMPWLDKVTAVVEAWYPGQEDGNTIAALLFGDVNPSGKLPITFPRSYSQTPAHLPWQWPGIGGVARYSEGIDVGYRWYDTRDLDPLFPFGFGLSYTTFAVHDLVAPHRVARGASAKLSAEVTNTGERAGAEVVQLYVGMPASTGEPPEQLKGYAKVSLLPGQTRRVEFTLTPQDLAYWNDTAGGWVTASGEYQIMVGTSSRDIAARAMFQIPVKRPLALRH